jgi:hypothetical protein
VAYLPYAVDEMKASQIYNQWLVDRMDKIWDFSFLSRWHEDLRKMNARKCGRPFKFPTALILFLALHKVTYHMPYRDLESMIRGLMQLNGTIRSPDYTTVFRRVQKLAIQIQDSIPPAFIDEIRRGRAKLAIDSSGLSVTCRGEWLRYKHNDGKIYCKRGFVKLHAGVDVRRGLILGVEITDEKCADSWALPSITYQAQRIAEVGVAYMDGAYDTHENFRELEKLKILPVIKPIRTGRVIISKEGYIVGRRSRYLYEIHKHGYDYWKKHYGYGRRWFVEVAFSSFKRRFGENLMSRSFKGMVQEAKLKVFVYNLITDWPKQWN